MSVKQSFHHLENNYVQQVREYAEKEGNKVIPICAKVEEEIAQLSPDERKEFLESLGLSESDCKDWQENLLQC